MPEPEHRKRQYCAMSMSRRDLQMLQGGINMISQKEKRIALIIMIGISFGMLISSIIVWTQCKDRGFCMKGSNVYELTETVAELPYICYSLLILTVIFIAALIAFSMFFYTEKGQAYMQNMYSEEIQRIRFRTVYPVMLFILIIHLVFRYYFMANLC